MMLKEIKEIKGRIILKSGLHIGAGDTEMHIGGTDNPVIRHPHTDEPYIPGSSIKGKVRSLLEMKAGLMVTTDGKPVQANHLELFKGQQRTDCENILQLFGTGGTDNKEMEKLGPTRAAFADCFLNKTWLKAARDERWILFETKSENSIDRIRGTASAGGPRSTERVPSGAEFDFVVTLKVLSEKEEHLFDNLLLGLKLLSLDALGGSGSRGYGRINIEFDEEQVQQRFDDIKLF